MRSAICARLLGLVGGAALMAVSCGTFPKEQLCLDLSGSDTPVMLNAVDKAAVKGKILSYEAGYKSQSVTVSASNGQTTATVTNTMSMNQNQPLGMQMQALLINEPEWVAIQGLSFRANLLNMVYVSTTSYMLRADAFVPAAKK
jgi:hypothetical protein